MIWPCAKAPKCGVRPIDATVEVEQEIVSKIEGEEAKLKAEAEAKQDGKWFVGGASSTHPLGVFEVATGREVHRLECNARTSAVSPDAPDVAATLADYFDLQEPWPVGASMLLD